MPSRARKATTPKVDETVENQENPGSSTVERPSTETTTEPEVVKNVPANDVDPTVENQENPISSEEERPSTETPEAEPEVPVMAPAMPVDDTVVNQENPGFGEIVDRTPEPQIVVDDGGISYDVSGSAPELVVDEPTVKEQNPAVLDPAEWKEDDEDDKFIVIVFVETGLSALGRVWFAGQTLRLKDNEQDYLATMDSEGNSWIDHNADEQKKRYGRVMFERR